jgi:hypothetical protein
MKHRSVEVVGNWENQVEAAAVVRRPGDVAIVERGVPRLLVMKCPDGCGDILRVNLDPRAGKAWKIYRGEDGLSLYPSVWRDTGCRSHFVVWDDAIYWGDDWGVVRKGDSDRALITAVLDQLSSSQFKSAEEISEGIDLVPWMVVQIAEELTKNGDAEARGVGPGRRYRRRA